MLVKSKKGSVCSSNVPDSLADPAQFVAQTYFKQWSKVWILHKIFVLHFFACYRMNHGIHDWCRCPMVFTKCNCAISATSVQKVPGKVSRRQLVRPCLHPWRCCRTCFGCDHPQRLLHVFECLVDVVSRCLLVILFYWRC
jgi:hypothetical protein